MWGGKRSNGELLSSSWRTFDENNELLWIIFLEDGETYTTELLRRILAITRALYNKIRQKVVDKRTWNWERKRCCFGKMDMHTDIKLLTTLTVFSTRTSRDSLDHLLFISDASVGYYPKQFCEDIWNVYGNMFLTQRPTGKELFQLYEQYEHLGFPGAVWCIECMKLSWNNCTYSENGQYQNHES